MKKDTRKIKSALFDLLYYAVLFLIVGGILTARGNASKGPKVFLGYSAFVVLTGSMEPDIPKGALVLTKHVDGSELQIGDDITYMVDETTSITHRIVRIEENYQNSGSYAFQTKGVSNNQADEKMVYDVNVVGKVIFHSVILGVAASFIQDNWPLLIFFIAMIILFTKVIRFILSSDTEAEDETSKDAVSEAVSEDENSEDVVSEAVSEDEKIEDMMSEDMPVVEKTEDEVFDEILESENFEEDVLIFEEMLKEIEFEGEMPETSDEERLEEKEFDKEDTEMPL